MKSRLLAALGAAAVTASCMVAAASPAAADQSYCYGWDTHPDSYSSGGITMLSGGTQIRRGPYTACDALGTAFPSQSVNVHCARQNSNYYLWFYVVDTTTGVAGWVQSNATNWDGSRIYDCADSSTYYWK